mmetsp:Transcript_14084/g.32783  ORF Transcript_14084/g.32783 Transcript_14084/m.32783 type:complete len:131 (-) Transcript_14084:32-424(-)
MMPRLSADGMAMARRRSSSSDDAAARSVVAARFERKRNGILAAAGPRIPRRKANMGACFFFKKEKWRSVGRSVEIGSAAVSPIRLFSSYSLFRFFVAMMLPVSVGVMIEVATNAVQQTTQTTTTARGSLD